MNSPFCGDRRYARFRNYQRTSGEDVDHLPSITSSSKHLSSIRSADYCLTEAYSSRTSFIRALIQDTDYHFTPPVTSPPITPLYSRSTLDSVALGRGKRGKNKKLRIQDRSLCFSRRRRVCRADREPCARLAAGWGEISAPTLHGFCVHSPCMHLLSARIYVFYTTVP